MPLIFIELKPLHESVKRSESILKIFKNYVLYLENQMNNLPPSESEFTWEMAKVNFPNHPQVELFFKSNQQELDYYRLDNKYRKAFNTFDDANFFAKRNQGFQIRPVFGGFSANVNISYNNF